LHSRAFSNGIGFFSSPASSSSRPSLNNPHFCFIQLNNANADYNTVSYLLERSLLHEQRCLDCFSSTHSPKSRPPSSQTDYYNAMQPMRFGASSTFCVDVGGDSMPTGTLINALIGNKLLETDAADHHYTILSHSNQRSTK
jgi:hypothetical protein